MKDYIAMSISEMECDDVTFEIEFEGWTDNCGPGPDESYIDIHKATLWCGKFNIDVTELMQRSDDIRMLIAAYLDQTYGD